MFCISYENIIRSTSKKLTFLAGHLCHFLCRSLQVSKTCQYVTKNLHNMAIVPLTGGGRLVPGQGQAECPAKNFFCTCSHIRPVTNMKVLSNRMFHKLIKLYFDI